MSRDRNKYKDNPELLGLLPAYITLANGDTVPLDEVLVPYDSPKAKEAREAARLATVVPPAVAQIAQTSPVFTAAAGRDIAAPEKASFRKSAPRTVHSFS